MDRTELAALLRQARERVHPVDVGLPAGSRRQVPGLRREEVAQLAGVSVDYVVRLEQGRGPRPSSSVLAALARALRLNDEDRTLLFQFAGAAPPQEGRIDMVVRPSVLRLLDRMADLPALVLSAKADLLAWNPMATALLGDFLRVAAHPAQHHLAAFPRHRTRTGDDDTRRGRQCRGVLGRQPARRPRALPR
ncbi:helix-turn-helix domain-containing protein [Nocardia sp. NPDC004750]